MKRPQTTTPDARRDPSKLRTPIAPRTSATMQQLAELRRQLEARDTAKRRGEVPR